MTEATKALEEEALGWIVRLRHADLGDWTAFDAWLAGDPARADAYWRLAAANADLFDAPTRKPPAAEVIPFASAKPRRARLMPMLVPIAASVALVLGIQWAVRHGPPPAPSDAYALETGPGERRSAKLPDGTRVALNGGTRLEMDRSDPRSVRLERGEARFDVTHDPRAPFSVHVGETSLRDIGTVFDVIRDGTAIRVAVAKGAVRYQDGSAAYRLNAGDSLTRDADGAIRTARVDPADVASWRDRRLTYDNVRFGLVAADLGRAMGLPVSVDPALSARRFSGGIRIDADAAGTVERAATLMGVRAVRDGTGWRLSGP